MMQSEMQNQKFDTETGHFLQLMAEAEQVRTYKVAGVKTVLVVLSARGMVFDTDSLKQKILHAYPDCVVFFRNTLGKSIGFASPDHVDLIIDFTGPGQRQSIFYARKLRKSARVIVGRHAGFFRKKIYDRVFDERASTNKIPTELLAHERYVQKEVMKLAGIALSPSGDTPPDLGKIIPLDLPPMQKL